MTSTSMTVERTYGFGAFGGFVELAYNQAIVQVVLEARARLRRALEAIRTD